VCVASEFETQLGVLSVTTIKQRMNSVLVCILWIVLSVLAIETEGDNFSDVLSEKLSPLVSMANTDKGLC